MRNIPTSVRLGSGIKINLPNTMSTDTFVIDNLFSESRRFKKLANFILFPLSKKDCDRSRNGYESTKEGAT